MMSIPAVKAVEIGLGKGVSDLPGSKVHDEIFLNDSKAMNHSAFNGTNNVQTRMVTRKPITQAA